MVGRIGVLALQGAFAKHCEMLVRIGVDPVEVRRESDLEAIEGLILPGGESTAMQKLNDLSLQSFKKPIFGTCAGMILMAQLGFLDVTLARNAYGRQCASFSKEITVDLHEPKTVHAIFIRAPRIETIDSPDVQVLSQEPVIVRQGHYLATSFHPELTKDPTIHEYFVHLCREKQLPQRALRTTPTRSFQTT